MKSTIILNELLKNCVIGFGITDKTISKLKSADGLVVGSALCKINESVKRQNPVIKGYNMVKKLQAEFYELDKKNT